MTLLDSSTTGSPEASTKPDGQQSAKPEARTLVGSEPHEEQQSDETSTEETTDVTPEDTTEQTEPEAPAEAEKKAPETYEFTVPEGLPEGHTLDQSVLDRWGEVARELDLPQEAAQKVVNELGTVLYERAAEAQKAQIEKWEATAREHPDITGGDGFDANIKAAEGAIQKFGSDGLRELLSQGIGNHPEFVAFAVKVGNALKPDGFVVGGPVGDKPNVNPNDLDGMANLIYGDSPRS